VISELEEAQKQLKEQANKDYLTGLYNRTVTSMKLRKILFI